MAVSWKFGRWFPFNLFVNPEKGIQRTEPASRVAESEILVTDERSVQVPVVFSCLRLISELVGVLPLDVFRRTKEGREADDSHRVAELLESPNPLMTKQEYLETVTFQIAGWGNSYSRIDRTANSEPKFIWPLIPAKMEPDRRGYDGIIYKYKHDENTETEYPIEKILHFKGFGGDGVVGLSVLAYARQALGIQIAAEQYAASFYKSGGKAASIFTPERAFDNTQRGNFQEWLNEIGRAQGAGVWALPIPGSWHDVNIPPEDAQMLVTRQFQVEEIARIFRVPLFLLNAMEKSTSWGTGLEQQNLAFLTYTLTPYLKRIETVMNRRLFTDEERKTHYVEFNVDALLRPDSKTRAEVWQIMLQNGVLNRTEVRAMMNLSAYGGSDVYTAQTNLAPIDKLGEIASAAAATRPEPKTDTRVAPLVVSVDDGKEQLASAIKEFGVGQRAGFEALAESQNKSAATLEVIAKDRATETKRLDALAGASAKAIESLAVSIESQAKAQREATKTAGDSTKEAGAELVTTIRDGFKAVVEATGKPRLIVKDKDGEPIGNTPVDKL